MSPFIEAIASEQEIEEVFDSKHLNQVRQEYAKQNRTFRRSVKFEEFFKRYPKSILLPQVKESAKGAALEQARESLTIAMSQAIGILCLTTKPDNLLMWAHYAKSHTGMVIELDGKHDFFHQTFNEPFNPTGIDEDLSKDYGYLKRVQYSPIRPSITVSSVKSFDSFLIKGQDWAYEEEWRMLMPTANAQKSYKDKQGIDIFLYSVPSEVITKVILGDRANDDLLKSVQNLKTVRKDFYHLQIEKMRLDEKQFKLIPKPV